MLTAIADDSVLDAAYTWLCERRIEKGFDFLGYHFSRDGLTVGKDTLKRFVERATRLYEQERGKPEGFPLLGLYVWLDFGRRKD